MSTVFILKFGVLKFTNAFSILPPETLSAFKLTLLKKYWFRLSRPSSMYMTSRVMVSGYHLTFRLYLCQATSDATRSAVDFEILKMALALYLYNLWSHFCDVTSNQ